MGAASLAVLLVGLPLGGLIWAATGGIPGTVHTPIAWVRLASSGARTLAISAVSAATCLVLGVPLAVAFNRFRFPGREALIAVAFVPFVLPTLAVAGGVSSLLGRGGWLEWLPGEPGNGLLGSVVAIVATNLVFNLGLVIRMVGPGVQALDSALVDSARVLGVPRSLAWWKVGLPSLRPVIVRSGSLVTLLAATNFGVVLILGSPASATVDLEIWYSVTQVFDLRSAAVMTFAQLAVLGLFVNWLMRRWGSTATSSVLGGARTHRPVALPPLSAATPVARFGVLLASAMVTAVVVAPIASLVVRAGQRGGASGSATTGFSWAALVDPLREPPSRLVGLWGAAGSGEVWARSAWVALAVGVLVAAVSMVLATGAGGGGGRLIEGLLVASLAISPAALGLGMLAVAQLPAVAAALDASGSTEASLLVWAMVASTFPFGLALVADAARGVSPRLIEAARVLGATRSGARRRVVAVVVAPSAAVAFGLAVAVAFGDVGVASFVTDGSMPTVAVVSRRFLARAQPDAYRLGLGLALWVAIIGVASAALSETMSRLVLRLARRSR